MNPVGFPAKELLKTCCETGEKWASANGHCTDMEPPTKDRHSICWTAQQQCCRGSLREGRCLAGMNAARAGTMCREDASDKCGIDSYKASIANSIRDAGARVKKSDRVTPQECCDCCSLGLQFLREGHRCEAPRRLGVQCRHVFLTCCGTPEEEEEEEEGGEGANRDGGWHSVRERPALDSTPLPKKISDSPYPKEAFSIGEERDGENAAEGPNEAVDVDECRVYEGSLCHHRCVNVPGSYRCECLPGYALQEDAFTCERAAARPLTRGRRRPRGRFAILRFAGVKTVDEENRLREDDSAAAAEPTSPPPPPTQPTSPPPPPTQPAVVPPDPCEDVNECLAGPCGQECANIYGSYQCYCRQGYHLQEDGHTCEDMDECSQNVGHLCTYKCVNAPGSYRYIDECALGVHNCSLAENCYNIQGGYRCLSLDCPPNYRKVSDTRCERISCPNYLECQTSPLRITSYYLSFQSNIVIPAQIFRIAPSPAYSGDNVIVGIAQGNEENYFGTRKLNAYMGAVYLNRQVEGQRDFCIHVDMKLWRQGTFTTFQAKIFVFITGNSL
ncbi:Fibulin-2 [Liparis tanakae]|uniref:Fibulin-2 n=1 Tax=Liparis tanakae TaxID=230148 RepID=A0A4Z2GBD8_9TELE|nr:Fibulin-2 [Liparis tanakae]